MQLPDPGTVGRFALLIGAAVISTVLFIRSQPDEARETRPGLSLAYYLDSAELTGTDASGNPLYRVWTDRAAQVPADDSISMQSVRMVYTPEGPQAWNLEAERGRIPADASVIELSGNVVVATATDAATRIRTQRLDVDPATQEARTPAAVVVDYDGNVVNATGLYADFRNNRLKLLSDVSGSFTP
jgi:LPS export ABC transporter protein LptC